MSIKIQIISPESIFHITKLTNFLWIGDSNIHIKAILGLFLLQLQRTIQHLKTEQFKDLAARIKPRRSVVIV